jgi:nucleoside-diphosphate-sugar epimerase
MKILVIGGTNFIGPSIVRQLCAMGHEITVFNRGQTHADLPSQVNCIQGDRNNLKEFKPEFERLAPQVVLDTILYNEADARILMDTFRGITSRIVAVSSMDVYRAYDVLWKREREIVPTPLTEDSPLRQQFYPFRNMPKTPFDRMEDYEKILVERVVMADPNLPGTIVRLPMIYGSGDFLHRFYVYLKRMEDRRPAILLEESVAQWRGSYGYVENVAHAIALVVTKECAINRIYHVAEPETPSQLEYICKLGEIVGWQGVAIALPRNSFPAEWEGGLNFNQHWVVDSSRIRQELGYEEIISIAEALEKTVAWQLSSPPSDRSFWEVSYLLDYATEDKILEELKL